MKQALLYAVLLSSALVVGCSTDKDQTGSVEKKENPPATAPAPDNTANNREDRTPSAVADPFDQGENKDDLAITQKIRQNIMDDDSLSANAKNVKIITEQKSVTLRGVVNSGAEKRKVERLAKQVSGVKTVDNQLEVAAG